VTLKAKRRKEIDNTISILKKTITGFKEGEKHDVSAKDIYIL
jgi:hypothetical protein